MTKLEILKSVKKKSAGRTNLIKYLTGKELNKRQAIIAKCCECMGYYVDGMINCKVHDSTLYPFMPYRRENEVVGDT